MKVRLGFVSNSSSSSFIIGFKRKPINFMEVIDHLKLNSRIYNVTSIAKEVFDEIKNQKELTREQMINICARSSFFVTPYHSRFEQGLMTYDDIKSKTKICIDEFLKNNEDMVFYVVTYDDGDGEFYSFLESGYAFDNIPHIGVNNH